jgi:hypothetical protein
MSLIARAPQPWRSKANATPPAAPSGPAEIVGTVRDLQLTGHRFQLWDDPEGRWLRTADDSFAALVVDAFAMETKLKVTVLDGLVLGVVRI